MDELSPSGIDNHHAVFHLADGIVVDEVFGLFGKGQCREMMSELWYSSSSVVYTT